jgi:dolichol kinase
LNCPGRFCILALVRKSSVRGALPRAAFHAAVGIAIAAFLFILPRLAVEITLGVITAALIALELVRLRIPAFRKRFAAWFAPLLRKEEDSTMTGSSYYLIGCLVSVLAFPREIAVPALLFLSLGDPAATIIGTWRGRVRFRGKSLEGDLACFAVCLAVAAAVNAVLHGPSLAVAFTGAVFAAIFQAMPLPLNDNLTIPVFSGLSMIITGMLLP